jgi:hypothetical protein
MDEVMMEMLKRILDERFAIDEPFDPQDFQAGFAAGYKNALYSLVINYTEMLEDKEFAKDEL